jgi:hypothetical protein
MACPGCPHASGQPWCLLQLKAYHSQADEHVSANPIFICLFSRKLLHLKTRSNIFNDCMYWVGRQMMQVWNKASTDNWSQGSLYRLFITNRKINCNHQWPPLSLLHSWIQPGTMAITQCSKVGSSVIRDSFKTLLNLLFSVIMLAEHVSYTCNFRLTLCCK